MPEALHAFATKARHLLFAARLPITGAAAVFLAALPLLVVETPPLFDLPAHVARLAVLLDEGASPQLNAMFDIRWDLLPNLALELVALPLSRVMSLDAAVWTFLLVALLLQLAGAALLSAAIHGRLTLLPFVAVFFLFNGILNFGFASYVFAVGLALIALAAWLLLRERSTVERIAFFVPSLTALYFCHLYGLGLFGLAAGAYELGRAARGLRMGTSTAAVLRNAGRHLGLLALVSAPSFLVLFLYSPTGSALSVTSWHDLWLLDAYLRKPGKLLFAFEAGVSWLDRVLLTAFGLTLLLAFARGWLRIARGFLLPIALLWLVFVLMPQTVASSWGADLRMPIGAALITLAALGWGSRASLPVRVRLGTALALLCVLRIGSVLGYWAPASRDLTEIRDLLGRIPKGASLTAAVAVENVWRGYLDGAYYHAGGYAVADRSAFYPTVFAIEGQQPITWTPVFEAKAKQSGMIDWPREAIKAAAPGSIPQAKALAIYDYVLVVRPEWFGNRLSRQLEKVAGGRTFSLMRVKRLTAHEQSRPPRAP